MYSDQQEFIAKGLDARNNIREVASREPPFVPTKGQRGALIGRMGHDFDVNRYIVWGWLFQDGDKIIPKQSANLTDSQWYALYDWVGYWQDENQEWRASLDYEIERVAVLHCALADYNNQHWSVIKDDPQAGSMLGVCLVDLGGVLTLVDTDDTEEVNGVRQLKPGLLAQTEVGRNILRKRRLMK